MVTRCPRCEAELQGAPNYCTRCGYALVLTGPTAVEPTAVAEPRFVSCPSCEATNAASRRECARCGTDLTGEDSGAVQGEDEQPDAAAVEEPSSPVVFTLAVAVAAIAIVGVIITILSASGIGPFARPSELPRELQLEVSAVRTSSATGSGAPELLVDGDPETAWREDASGDGVGEWVELQLAGSAQVNRLVVWNGAGDGADPGARPSELRIDIGDRTFVASLLDVDGPQAIDLPETLEASSLRLTIAAVDGEGAAAISEVEVRGPPPEGALLED